MGQTQEQIDVRYSDDIFVGYRYFDTFNQEVLYPFGYGLDYGKTEITAYAIAVTGDNVAVTVTVENTGDVYPARQVVQTYISCPEGRLEQPLQKLCAFGKTKLLPPGESETMTLEFRLSDVASFDERVSSYVLEKGYYYIRVGINSRSHGCSGSGISAWRRHYTDSLRSIGACAGKLRTFICPGGTALFLSRRE